jgi:hypothetical protein
VRLGCLSTQGGCSLGLVIVCETMSLVIVCETMRAAYAWLLGLWTSAWASNKQAYDGLDADADRTVLMLRVCDGSVIN